MRAIIKAALRIIIIILFITLLRNVLINVQIIILGYHNEYYDNIFIDISIFIGFFILSTALLYFFWRKTDWFVKILAGKTVDTELTISTSNIDLLKVAMRILGMYLIITSIPDLIGLSAYHIRLLQVKDFVYPYTLQAEVIKDAIVGLITFGIGIWLLLGTRRITRIIDNIGNLPISEVKDE